MEWIKCSDRTPNFLDCVGYITDGQTIRADGYYDQELKRWAYQNNLDYDVEIPGITHWMPLPNFPND